LIILKNTDHVIKNENIEIITYEDYQKLDIDRASETDFGSVSRYLKDTREKAICEKSEEHSAPVCVEIKNDDIYGQCARCAYYICKYANMIVFEEFNEKIFSPLLMLRYNIFTDPQKTLQVEGGLYSFNNPDRNSIVFLTTNFALTYFAVANELENLDIPSYLIVVPAQGMSVLTAWSAQTLTSDIVIKAIKDFEVKDKINTRKIIISGLLSELKEELNEQCPDFEFVEGTRDASDIAEFVKNYLPL
jgi:acetyl-CoA decarbonylase/synthase complex subunit gamma